MRAVIQRVSEASVTIDCEKTADIGKGLVVFIGIEEADTNEDIHWLVSKIINLRIFSDSDGIMNLSVSDVDGEIIVVSQFTLHASTKKGNRPSYIKAAKPDTAIPLYEEFVKETKQQSGKMVQTGRFGADMKVLILNDGPVTITIDSKNRA